MNYCPNCGKPLIDNELKFCPYCGSAIVDEVDKDKRVSRIPKSIFIVIPIVIAIVVINGLIGSSSSCEYGNTCSFSDFDITTSNIEESDEGVKVDVEFLNSTDMVYPISYTDFALIDNENVSYSGYLSTNADALSFESIVSNSKKKFTVYFDKDSFEDVSEIRFEGVSEGSYAIKLDAKAIIEKNERINKEEVDEEQRIVDETAKETEEDLKDIEENPPYMLQKYPEYIKYLDCLYSYDDNILTELGFIYDVNEQNEKYIIEDSAYPNEIIISTRGPSHDGGIPVQYILFDPNDMYERIDFYKDPNTIMPELDASKINKATKNEGEIQNDGRSVVETSKNGMFKFVYTKYGLYITTGDYEINN